MYPAKLLVFYCKISICARYDFNIKYKKYYFIIHLSQETREQGQ